MMSGIHCKPGEVVLIPFPFSDLRTTKKRPVLVLTAPDTNGDFVCLAITSVAQVRNAIVIDYDDMEEGELPRKSWIRLGKIFTLEQSLIVHSVGRINGSVLITVLRNLCETVGYRV